MSVDISNGKGSEEREETIAHLAEICHRGAPLCG